MLDINADQINLEHVPVFKAKLQGLMDDLDLVMSTSESHELKRVKVAGILNGIKV